MHYHLTDIQADFEINRHNRYQITAKGNYFHRRQTDRHADRQTGRPTDGRTDNRYFFSKKEKSTKNNMIGTYRETCDIVKCYIILLWQSRMKSFCNAP